MKSLRRIFLFIVIIFLVKPSSFGQPLKVDFEKSASYHWLKKEVYDTVKLDDMESLNNWQAFTVGAEEVVDARKISKPKEVANVAAISLSAEKVHNGNQSLLMKTPVRLEGPAPKNGRGWGRSGIRRIFDGEDWSKFNRISLWIYPDLPGFYTTALDIHLFNDGIKKIPALFGQEGETSIVLRDHEWNHVVWEISNVPRDKITDIEISYGLSGNAPGEADSIQFYFDQLNLEKVDPDKIEGWDVWPGRISYSQDGYQTGAMKTAIANGLDAKEFKVINQDDGDIELSKPIEIQHTHLGDFQVMDFSEIRKSGNYVLEAGKVTTHPFPIGLNIWEASTWKVLNFLYTERCGAAIPGVHGVCHRDWSCVHNGKRIMINGGWHDAGDLSQGLGNTAEIDYGLFSLAERLHAEHENPALDKRLIEEARWGLDWILKTSFGDGYRSTGSINSRRTNDILGDDDDVIATARNNPLDNFMASAAEAIAARVLKESDPRLAAFALKMAKADWKFGIDGMANAKSSGGIWTGTFDSDNIEFEVAAEAILAAVDLWKVTNDNLYEEKATGMARVILNSQQRKKTDWDTPLTGFFYATTTKDRILHFVHRGRGQAHILALTQLCNAFPGHPDYMKWYAAITLYSEYLKTISKYTAPYNVMPASVYTDTEYLNVPESRRESFRKQVLDGIPLGKGHYLRLFPVWMDYRGHFGTILPEAQALASAAHLRGDLAGAQLAEHQPEWIIGRNPFSESTMYGEGYDFAPLYSPSSGDMVGSLPVGIQTHEDNDVPYWPVQSTWTYKEVWVHPAARWIWLMRDLSGPAMVEGQAVSTVIFKEINTGQAIVIEPDITSARFHAALPEGTYIVKCNGEEQTQTFLAADTYNLDLRPEHILHFETAVTKGGKDDIVIKINVYGTGTHYFNIRADNLTVTNTRKDLLLKPGQTGTIEWHARIASVDTPWVALIIPDNNMQQREEIKGAAWEK